ncbi:hypothetical protein [Pilibacter termitis]|nr:hypothetical protein [Pilibacter termitis]
MFLISSAICFSFSMFLFCGIEISKIVMNGEGNFLHEAMKYPIILLVVSILLLVIELWTNDSIKQLLNPKIRK